MSKKKIKLGPTYNCTLCGKQFSKSGLLQAHKKTHSAAMFACKECKYIGTTKKYLARHVERTHRKSKLVIKCDFCKRRFQFKSQMEHHKLVHTGEKPYKCKTCGKGFNSHYSLNTHQFIHTGQKPFQCSFCDYACRDSSTLRRHQHRHMGIETVFNCTQCDKQFKKKSQLKVHVAEKHLNICVRNHECKQCGKMFRTQKAVGLHVRNVHARAAAARCELCGRESSSAQNLAAHLRTHAPLRPFACAARGCRVACRDRGGLRRHMAEKHSGVRPHRCDQCGKGFYRKAHLRRHVNTHAPRRRAVQCDYCKVYFYSKNYLIKHINDMHNPKPPQLECDECGFITRNKIGMILHLKGSHAPPEVECKICHSIYKRPTYLKLHYLRTHGIRYKMKQRKPPVVVKEEPAASDDDDTSLDLFEVDKHELDDVSDAETHKTLSELLGVIASNQTTIQEIDDPVSLKEIQPMREIIEAAQEIQEVLNNDSNNDKPGDDVDKSVNDSVKKCTRQQKGQSKLAITVQDIDTSTKDNAKKFRRKKKATTHQDKEIKYDKSSEDGNTSIKDSTKMSTEDKGLNQNLTLYNELQELEHEQKTAQDVKDLEIEHLQENQYDNHIEIEVPFEIPQTKRSMDDICQQLTITETPGQEIGLQEVEIVKEIEQPIKKKEIPIEEDKQAIKLVQDIQIMEETLIPFEDKQKEEFETCIEEINDTIQETTQSFDEITQPIKETTQPVEDTTQPIEEITQPIEETTQPIQETTQSSNETSQSIEDEVKNFEYSKVTTMKDIPKSVFEKFYTSHISYIGNKEKDPHQNVEENLQKEVSKLIQQKLAEVRQKKQVKALERARRQYNQRMKRFLNNAAKKKETVNREFVTKISKQNNKINDHDTNDGNDSNDESLKDSEATNEDLNDSEAINEDSDSKNNETYSLRKREKRKVNNDESLHDVADELDNDNDSDYENDFNDKKRKINKLKFNTHQCYVCFKLYKTKSLLIDHCKEHFDVCSEELLKKCPLCPFVGRKYFSKHLKAKHDITLNINYGTVGDRNDNSNGSRYYYKIKNKNIDKIEIIPSVQNLNRMAYTKIDRKRREDKEKAVAKTKLVKKGKEWVVEDEKINIKGKDFILPKFDKELLKNITGSDNNEYLDNLKKLYQIAKKEGKKMLFPCQNCDKICQNLSALTLHSRKHDPNAKPFKKKVWKHKLKNANAKPTEKSTKTNEVSNNRLEKPKPIKNKHKCDPELKEFYEKNIRGGDIEFWQFLKIFNKMGRENIKDFKDLRGRLEYGMEPITAQCSVSENIENDEASTNPGSATPKDDISTINNNLSTATKAKNRVREANKAVKGGVYKRVVRLSRKEFHRRILLKRQLRESIAKNFKKVTACSK